MSRYNLFTERLANMLTPTFERGRDNVLWIQSILKPLQMTNDTFQSYTNEKIIEASMSSQVMHFEWYLNYKLIQYFVDQGSEIVIQHYVDLGVPIFDDGELGEIPFVIWDESEDWSLAIASEQPQAFYFEAESLSSIGASFKILVPELTIPTSEFDVIIKHIVEKYRLAGRTYIIEYN